MKKDVGEKRRERAKASRAKVLRRREALHAEARGKRKQELLSHKTRRRQEPVANDVLRQKLGGSTDVLMSEERKIDIDEDCLARNFDVLKGMHKEFVELDRRYVEHKEKSNGKSVEDGGDRTPDRVPATAE